MDIAANVASESLAIEPSQAAAFFAATPRGFEMAAIAKRSNWYY